MDAKTINKFPIRKYLAGRGIHPAKDRGYYGLYHSPLREDRNPSMKVDYDKICGSTMVQARVGR